MPRTNGLRHLALPVVAFAVVICSATGPGRAGLPIAAMTVPPCGRSGSPATVTGGGPSYGFEWANVGRSFFFTITVDAAAATMLAMVSIVALLVMIYSTGYMHDDPLYARFFAFLALFSSSMLGLVLSSNLILLFMCWELVGLMSYLLIGFWFHKPEAARACKNGVPHDAPWRWASTCDHRPFRRNSGAWICGRSSRR